MRWIFWRHKVPLKNETAKDSPVDRPETITLFIDTQESNSPTHEVHGLVIPPIIAEPGRERFPRHRRKLTDKSVKLNSPTSPDEPAHGISALLHLPQILLHGRGKLDGAAEMRIAYFQPGEYAGRSAGIRMISPALRRAFWAPAVIGRSQSLLAIGTNAKLPPARKEG